MTLFTMKPDDGSDDELYQTTPAREQLEIELRSVVSYLGAFEVVLQLSDCPHDLLNRLQNARLAGQSLLEDLVDGENPNVIVKRTNGYCRQVVGLVSTIRTCFNWSR